MLIVTSLGGMLRTETKCISYSLNFDSVAPYWLDLFNNGRIRFYGVASKFGTSHLVTTMGCVFCYLVLLYIIVANHNFLCANIYCYSGHIGVSVLPGCITKEGWLLLLTDYISSDSVCVITAPCNVQFTGLFLSTLAQWRQCPKNNRA